MNPDKLFDYLDGKLPDHERQALEERLMSDASARREFDVARRILGEAANGQNLVTPVAIHDATRK